MVSYFVDKGVKFFFLIKGIYLDLTDRTFLDLRGFFVLWFNFKRIQILFNQESFFKFFSG